MTSANQKNLSNFYQIKKNINEIDSKLIKNTSLQNKSKNLNLEETCKDDEEILTRFDFNPMFGPAIGLTRTERYENALKFELNPPRKIMTLINRSNSNISYFDKK